MSGVPAESVTIVGFGLIGGSIALGLRRAGVRRIVAVEHRASESDRESSAVADEVVLLDDERGLARVLAETHLVVLAAPVSAIEALLPRVLDVARTVTDAGSTKRSIAQKARAHPRAGRFVPGHPMAGKPRGGLGNADPDLFRGRPWILCPEGVDADALAMARSVATALGAVPVEMTTAEHDRAVALTSHVPQILASALSALADARGARSAAGPAFESATRVAGGPEAMWRDVFASNADEIAEVLRALREELQAVERALGQARPDVGAALELLGRARRS